MNGNSLCPWLQHHECPFDYDNNSHIFPFLGPILGKYSIHFMDVWIEEHHWVWLGIIFHRHGTHLVLACLLIGESLWWSNFIVLQALGTLHQSTHWACSLGLQEANAPCYILVCPDHANALWVPSVHRREPHRSAHVVAERCGYTWQTCTLGKHSLYPCNEYILCIALILCYSSCCVPLTFFCFLLLIFHGVIM